MKKITVFLTLPVPSQFYSITDRKINGKGLSLYYIPCTVVPSLYRTTKSSKEGRGEDGVSTRPCAQTWHARGTGDGLLPSSLSCTFFLGLFQGSCLLHLLHFSVNFHHPPQCPSRTPRSYLLEGNKLFSPHVFRENKMSSPRPRRERQRRNTFGICEECCDVASFSAVSALPKIMSLSQRWPHLND